MFPIAREKYYEIDNVIVRMQGILLVSNATMFVPNLFWLFFSGGFGGGYGPLNDIRMVWLVIILYFRSQHVPSIIIVVRLYVKCEHARFWKWEFSLDSYCFDKGKRKLPKSSSWLEWWSMCASAILMDWHHMLWRTSYPCSDFVSLDFSCYSIVLCPSNLILLCKWTADSLLIISCCFQKFDKYGSFRIFITFCCQYDSSDQYVGSKD